LRALAKGLALLVLFQLAGETLVDWLGIPLPGPVAGMILLFLALQVYTCPVFARPLPLWLGSTASRLLGLLSLFFLPACVGVFFLDPDLLRQWPVLLAATIIATLLASVFTALLLTRLLRGRADGD